LAAVFWQLGGMAGSFISWDEMWIFILVGSAW
jgi:hypothetical protein